MRFRSGCGEFLTSSKRLPSMYSETMTRSRLRSVIASGTVTKGWPRYARDIARWFDASSS